MTNKMSYGIAAIILGLVLLGVSIPDVIPMLKEPKDGLEMEAYELHAGDHLEMDINTAVDYIITETTTESVAGRTSSRESSRYYGVPVFVVEEDMVYVDHILLVQVSSNVFSAMDRAVDSFNAWWDDESGETEYPSEVLYHADGRLRRLSSEEKKHVAEYFEDEDYEEYCPSYVLIPFGQGVWTFFAAGAVILIIGVVLLVVGIKTRKAEKEAEARRKEQLQASGYYSVPQEGVTFNNGSVDDRL